MSVLGSQVFGQALMDSCEKCVNNDLKRKFQEIHIEVCLEDTIFFVNPEIRLKPSPVYTKFS